MPRPLTHEQQQRWFALKDDVRVRARNRCEWCSIRPMSILHHRTYARYGDEHAEDVMGVCSACHKAIHGLLPWVHGQLPTIIVGVGSLADRGDSGMGESALWRRRMADWQRSQPTWLQRSQAVCSPNALGPRPG